MSVDFEELGYSVFSVRPSYFPLFLFHFIFFPYNVCAEDFSEMVRQIFFKFSEMVHYQPKFVLTFLKYLFRSVVTSVLFTLTLPSCPRISSKSTRARKLNFQDMIEDILIWFWANFNFAEVPSMEAKRVQNFGNSFPTPTQLFLLPRFLRDDWMDYH